MKTSSITTVSSFLSVVLAQPHLHNHHARHQHEKREIIWETAWEVVTETVGITTTITVDPQAAPTPTTTVISTPVAAPSASDSPGVFIEPSSTSSSVFVAPTTSSTPVAVVPPVESTSTTPVFVAPTTSTTFSSIFTPPPAPTTSSTSIFAAPTTSTTSSAAAVTSSASGSTTNGCSESAPCTGDLTYYQTGEGACGWDNDGTTENVVALSYLLMGTESNDGSGGTNPYCGKTITINYGGKTTTAKVVDKCMGCGPLAIDLSTLAFSDVADMALGRVSGEWYFNE